MYDGLDVGQKTELMPHVSHDQVRNMRRRNVIHFQRHSLLNL